MRKLYFCALTKAQLAAMVSNGMPPAVMMDGVPFPFIAYREDEITTTIDVSEWLKVKLAGIRCHATQLGPDNPFITMPEEVTHRPWLHAESYTLARSTVGWPQSIEADLLEHLEVCCQRILLGTLQGDHLVGAPLGGDDVSHASHNAYAHTFAQAEIVQAGVA